MTKIQQLQYGVKIILDKVFALLLLIVLSPILVCVGVIIKLDSEGPVFFKQVRLGKDGVPFIIYKFRTMCEGAVNKGTGIHVTHNDFRITKVGGFLRKSSIDELPQLLNILKGQMSFVGPRPPLEDHPYLYEEYSNRQKKRFSILPGITGYAQAYGRNAIDWHERIEMDLRYCENFALWFDLKIIFATFISVLFARGIYSSGDKKGKRHKCLRQSTRGGK